GGSAPEADRPRFEARPTLLRAVAPMTPAVSAMPLTISRDHNRNLAAWRPFGFCAPELRHAVDERRSGVVKAAPLPRRRLEARGPGALTLRPRPPAAVDAPEPEFAAELAPPPPLPAPVFRVPATPEARSTSTPPTPVPNLRSNPSPGDGFERKLGGGTGE